MYRYLFTNDLRISTLNESLQKAGKCFLEDTIPSATEDKSANNNMNTLGFYFNLTYKGECAKAACEGKIREVVFNFIKKFQFPNMRTKAAYKNSVEDGIILAPMRMIVRVLYTMSLIYGSTVAYLSKEEIKYFIFYNANVAKKKNPNLIELISQIMDYRKTKTFPDNVDTDENNHEWKQEDRQLREMIKTLTWSGCVEENENKIRINNSNLTRDNKADIYDIINCSDYWEGTTLESYQKYMDLSEHEISEDRNDNSYEDEYEKAAKYINTHIFESGLSFSTARDEIDAARNEFIYRFGPDVLSSISDNELLDKVFFSIGDNTESLCYWLEMNKDCRKLFGSISGGSSYKFGLFQKKETGLWTTGSPQRPQELTEVEALELGKEIVSALIKGARIIETSELKGLSDYEELDDRLREEVGERFYDWAWFHKYYSIIYNDKLSSFHNVEWQNHVLRCFGIRPSEKYYARSGQIAMIQNNARLLYREFIDAVKDRFGERKNFVRIGTTSGNNDKRFADEWKSKSIVAIGGGQIGSLNDYLSSQGIDRQSIAAVLVEKYYEGDSRTASKKAGELVRFYNTGDNTVFVAMEGEQLKGLIDNIGEYKYVSSEEFGHIKTGKWSVTFADGEYLPDRTEGKLTSCYELCDEDNMLYLYRKYYYHDEDIEEMVDDSNPEESNKRMFRVWMEKQVKSEGDSDAGEAYSSNSIDQYVSNIANTPLYSMSEKSVFFTKDIRLIKMTITELDAADKKNNTQRSAVKKYLQYAIDTGESDMSVVFKTTIETEYERNRIIFGAPGTGKSYLLKQDCDELMDDTVGTYERVTFHPDYTYSQFVGTYKPVMDTDGRSIRYDFVPGPFMRVYVDALKSARTEAPQPHLLIIEEINRAKVAAVFGDVFQLLDRDVDGVSEYEIQASEDIRRYLAKELGGTEDKYKRIRIPNNMFIWATMNSADQGVYPMDTAFKRRWNFEYLGIDEKEKDIENIGKVMIVKYDEPIVWNKLRKAINTKMSKDFNINEDKLMGPFFLSKKVLESDEDGMIKDSMRFMDAFKSKVIMYLYEDAVKQSKRKFFDGCDSSKYSSVCDAFDEIGMNIFGANFISSYYEQKRDDVE